MKTIVAIVFALFAVSLLRKLIDLHQTGLSTHQTLSQLVDLTDDGAVAAARKRQLPKVEQASE